MCILFKHYVQRAFLVSNCVDMGIQAIAMDKKKVSFKMISGWCQLKGHVDELFTSANTNLSVYVI